MLPKPKRVWVIICVNKHVQQVIWMAQPHPLGPVHVNQCGRRLTGPAPLFFSPLPSHVKYFRLWNKMARTKAAGVALWLTYQSRDNKFYQLQFLLFAVELTAYLWASFPPSLRWEYDGILHSFVKHFRTPRGKSLLQCTLYDPLLVLCLYSNKHGENLVHDYSSYEQ